MYYALAYQCPADKRGTSVKLNPVIKGVGRGGLWGRDSLHCNTTLHYGNASDQGLTVSGNTPPLPQH